MGLRFHPCRYEQPPRQGACGTTNSRWLAGDRCNSNNDLRLERLNSSSDDLRSSAVVRRPSPTSPHEGRGQAVEAKEPEVRPRVAPMVSSAETTSSGCHHLSTDDSDHRCASATPMNGGRPSLHRQIPACVGRSPLKSSRADQRWPPRGPSGRRRRRRWRQSQLSQHVRHAGADDACRRPDHVVEVRPVCKVGDSSHLRTARPSPGWRTDSCTLAREQQFAFPRMAGGRHLRRAGGCPSPTNAGGRSGSPAHAGGGIQPGAPSSSARMMKILEAEGRKEAVARTALPHHEAGGHRPG
jgi:hypothetical protein